MIKDALGETFPELVLHGLPRKFRRGFFELGAELRVGFIPPREADDCERGGQIAVGGDVVERRDELAMGQVAGGAEDDDGARLRHRAAGEPLAQRIGRGLGERGRAHVGWHGGKNRGGFQPAIWRAGLTATASKRARALRSQRSPARRSISSEAGPRGRLRRSRRRIHRARGRWEPACAN